MKKWMKKNVNRNEVGIIETYRMRMSNLTYTLA